MGFKITWRLLSMGQYGCDDIPVIINLLEVIEYSGSKQYYLEEKQLKERIVQQRE